MALMALWLTACGTAEPQATGTPTATQPPPAITPYLTNTPAELAQPTSTPAPTFTLPPLPTATPYLHTIVENNTLIGIANYYGVSIEELMTANPGIDPNFLTIGDQLIIPLPQADTNGENITSVQAEVLALETGPATCYRLRSDGWWCFFDVANPLEQPAENITALVRLFDADGQVVASQTVAGLMNVLPPGESMPIAAFFTPPVETWQDAQGQLLSAAEANQVDSRYLTVTLGEVETAPLDEDQLTMEVSGSLQIPEDVNAEYLWVLAVAYDADGAIAGVRRWEAPAEQLTGGEVAFSFPVYSLGKPIDHITLLAEARAGQ